SRPASHSLLIVCSGGPLRRPRRGRRGGSVVVQVDDRADLLGAELGGIVASLLDTLQVGLVDVTSDVFAVEYGAVEAHQLGVALTHGFFQILEILVDQPVRTDQLADFVGSAAVGDQLVGAGHVDTIDVRVANRRRSRAEIDVLGTGVAGHLDDLLAGGAADDGVVDQHHVLAAELQLDGVELLAHRLLAGGPAGHDQGPAAVAVLPETYAELHAQAVGQLQCRGAAG